MRPSRTSLRARRCSALGLLLATTTATAGCSFGPFDDLEQQVPVARVERGGGLNADFFGGLILGLRLPEGDEGGALLAAGSGSRPGLLSARFGIDGEHRTTASSGSQYRTALDLEEAQPRSLAAVPASLAPLAPVEARLAYVGATSGQEGRVVLADFAAFKALATLRPADLAQAVDFGAAVVGFALGDGEAKSSGLLVGGRGRLWAYRFADWPRDPAEQLIAEVGASWPSSAAPESTFTTLAAGNLDGSADGADELIVAAADSNFVAVLRPSAGLTGCAGSSTGGCPLTVIPAPTGATGFGRALLVANIDADPEPELLVGAPKSAGGSGAVYAFDFDSDAKATLRFTLEAPEAGEAFGHALAIGRFEGSERVLLAVGAPAAQVNDATSAGRIYLFKLEASTEPPVKLRGAELGDAAAGQLLGQTLTVVPFRRGEATAELLATNGTDAALVFFANLTDQQLDLRVR
ncbi:MAG: hypothetical protein IPL40_03410 [Proteobacteria bacterium]|nr:hypothetical protein [Pseudomonadota bacterium]